MSDAPPPADESTASEPRSRGIVSWVDAAARLDRRWIFLLMALAVGIPTLLKLQFPEKPGGLSQRTFAAIESLPSGSRVLLSFDFDPASEGELGPMATSLLRHCAAKGHRVYLMCLWPLGEQMIDDRLRDVIRADFPDLQYGRDYVNLGFKNGNEGVIKVIATDFRQMYPTDKRGTALEQIAMCRDIESVRSFDLLVSVSAGFPGAKEWVQYAAKPQGVPLVAGATGVQSPGLYPYAPEPLRGLLAAIKGAADYEKLVVDAYGEDRDRYGEARRRMGPQLVAHLLVIGLIVAGNVLYLLTGGRPTKRAATPAEAAPLPRWLLPSLAAIGLVLLVRLVFAGNGQTYVSSEAGAVSVAPMTAALSGDGQLSLVRTAGVWVAALCTLAIFSFLWRDNPVYKVAEAVLVGVSAAYWMVVSFWTVFLPFLVAPLLPNLYHQFAPGTPTAQPDDWWLAIVPLVLGVMLLMRLSRKASWVARWPLAFIVGTTAGLKLVGFLEADLLGQVENTIQAITVFRDDGSGGYVLDVGKSVAAGLVVTATLAALAYFFFSAEHRGALGVVSRVGIWVLMITFGAAFAYTVMGRIALLQIRLEFLLDDWLWLIDSGGSRFG